MFRGNVSRRSGSRSSLSCAAPVLYSCTVSALTSLSLVTFRTSKPFPALHLVVKRVCDCAYHADRSSFFSGPSSPTWHAQRLGSNSPDRVSARPCRARLARTSTTSSNTPSWRGSPRVTVGLVCEQSHRVWRAVQGRSRRHDSVLDAGKLSC